MGWTFFKKPEGQSVKDALALEFSGCRIVDSATKGSTVYLAVERDGKTHAYVVLTKRDNREVHNFGYKEMHEGMGPCYYDCPARILDLLSPTEDKYATEWRAKCREVEARKTKLVSGCYIQFAEEIPFTNGKKLSKFIYKKEGRREYLIAEGGSYRISDWKTRAFEVIA